MPIKSEKLIQNLQSLQSFLQRKMGQDRQIELIIQELKQLEDILETKKLVLQIVSDNEILSQALFDYLNSQPNFSSNYQIRLDTLPDIPKQIRPEVNYYLTLNYLLENTTKIEQNFLLPSEGQIYLGRNPENEIILNDSYYHGISWQHARILISTDEMGKTFWQIEDNNSTNGTFVNGNRIIGNQILQLGDEITLANPTFEKKIVRLLFCCQTITPDAGINETYLDVINSDVLLLIINLENHLSDKEQLFIKNIDNHLIAKQFLVPELSGIEDERVIDLENYLKEEVPESSFEILPVFLKPYYLEDYSREIDKFLQKKQDQFLKAIENPIKRQPENILAARLCQKLSLLLEPIDYLLAQEKKDIKDKISQQQKELEKITQVNIKEVTKKAFGLVNEDKDKFFKKVKLDITQAKMGALDNFSKSSIIYQVQKYIDNLEPVIIKRDGQFYIQLFIDSSNLEQDINQNLIDFCFEWIEKWSNKEWNKIIYSYNSGGVNELIERIKNTLSIIPSTLQKTPFNLPQSIDIRGNLMISFVGINCETRHKKLSLLTYLMKEIRSNLMQYMMMLTLVLSIIGIKGGKNQIFEKLSGWFKSYPWSLGLMIFVIFLFLMNAYNSDNQSKLEEVSEKLRKELASYYQSLSKNLLEKIIQEFNVALDYEAKKIDDAIVEIQSNYNEYILDTEKSQIKLQKDLEEYKEKEKNIDKEIIEFQKLMRM
jgi:hypothetical protein